MPLHRMRLLPGVPQSIVTPWQTDTMMVQNHSRYTLLVRAGSNSAPKSVTDADIRIGPLGMAGLPIEGDSFGFLLTGAPAAPELVNAPPGLAGDCDVWLLSGERAPAFATAPLASVFGASPDDQVILDVVTINSLPPAFGSWTKDVPSDVSSLTLVIESGHTLADVEVVGSPSGLTLCKVFPANTEASLGRSLRVNMPFYPALDTAVQIVYSTIGSFGAIGLLAHRFPHAPLLHGTDRRPAISVIPPARSDLPVSVVGTVPVVATRADFPAVNILALAARIGAQVGLVDLGGAGPHVLFTVYVTVRPGVETLTLSLQDGSGSWNFWISAAAIAAPGVYHYLFGPGARGAGGALTERYDLPVPDGARFALAPSGGGSWTYMVAMYRHY